MKSIATGRHGVAAGQRSEQARGAPWARKVGRRQVAVAGAALLAASGAVHLYLYFNGYGPVPTIGDLFLFQFAACMVAAGAIAASRRGPLVPAVGALLALATLGGYLLSLTVKLFGFREVPTGYGALAGGLEVAAFALLGSVALARSASGPPGPGTVPTVVRRAGPPAVPAVTLAAALALALELVTVGPLQTAGAGRASRSATVVVVRLPRYGPVLATRSHMSLYLLSDEKPGRVTCNSGCLSIWPPLLLHAGQRSASGGSGARGRWGVIDRGTARQVTYNGFPLYTYAGDPGPASSAGQGIVSYGGTWYLVRASATTPSSTPVR